MPVRTIAIVPLIGDWRNVEIAREDVSGEDIMRAIEFNLGIPGCKQRLLWDDVLLTVRDRIPNDADVTLNLVVTKASQARPSLS